MPTLDPLDQIRLQRGAAHLHCLGPRATFEFLLELAEKIGGLPATIGLLIEYQRKSPALLRAVGGDRFSPRPLRVVPRDLRRGDAS
jgi:hypothetical protein